MCVNGKVLPEETGSLAVTYINVCLCSWVFLDNFCRGECKCLPHGVIITRQQKHYVTLRALGDIVSTTIWWIPYWIA